MIWGSGCERTISVIKKWHLSWSYSLLYCPLPAGFNPVWNETLNFVIHTPELALVRFEVEDYDKASRNDFIGQFTLPFTCIQAGEQRARWKHQLQLSALFIKHVDKITLCQIPNAGELRIHSIPLCLKAFSNPNPSTSLLFQDIVTYICSLKMEPPSLPPPSLSTSASAQSKEEVKSEDMKSEVVTSPVSSFAWWRMRRACTNTLTDIGHLPG